MISLDLIVSFTAAARHASFVQAARELGLSPSAVAKNVARFEAQLGIRLFYRTTRQVRLSADGENVYDRCRRIMHDVESLEATASEGRSQASGTLRIDMPVTYGRLVVLPVLFNLTSRHPALKIDARFSDHLVDVVKEGLDAAVRIGPLADSSLVGREFDQQRVCTYSSPAYLAQFGEPRSPEELAKHTCLLFRLPSSGRDRPWQFRSGKRNISLTPEGRVRLGDGEALIQAAVAGLGIVQAPTYFAERDVGCGRLVEVLQQFRPAPLPISLVYPGPRYVPLRVRVLADALAKVHGFAGT
jgi:DNA-binding transcriptional LysR family regulator